jgi:outer membrane protein assembly factor BamB
MYNKVMFTRRKKCYFLIFFSFYAISVFAQEREQGRLTLDPYWRQALGGEVLSIPSVQVQSAVVALDGGNIRAYSTIGTPMWNYSARGRISPYVTRSREGTSYFSRTNGTLIAINRSGRELWRRSIGDPLCAPVVTGWDGRLFVPTDKKIFCFTASGNLLWTKTFEASFKIPPKLDRSGGIVFSLENNEVYRMNPFGNAEVWITANTPSVLLSIEQQRVMALFADGTMEILGLSENWFLTAQSDVHSSLMPKLPSAPLAAVSRGNNIAVVLNNGKVALFSLAERKILWESESHIRDFSGGTEMEILYDERGIYILNRSGASGFSHDGRRIWFILLQNAAAIPAFGDDGVLYSGGKDWILYTYKIEDSILSANNSLYGPNPEGSYGTGTPQFIYAQDFPVLENEMKNKLEEINSAVSSGNVGANEPEWTTFLMVLSSSKVDLQSRVTALRLLGKIGSRETISWLANIFRRENEPSLKAAAAGAIGAIGVDPQGVALQTFLYSITPGNIKDEQVLIAVTSATGDLCRFSGPPLSESGIRILNLLSESTPYSLVRRQANKELASLW